MSDYAAEQEVAFGKYSAGIPPKERTFEEGQILVLIEVTDQGTDTDPCFLAQVKDTPEKQGFVYASELGDTQTEEAQQSAGEDEGGEDATPAATPSGKGGKPAATKKKTLKVSRSKKKTPAKKKAVTKKKTPAKKKAASTVKKKVAAKKKTVAPAKKKTVAKKRPVAGKPAQGQQQTSGSVKLVHSSSVAKLVEKGGAATLKAATQVADRIGSDFYTLGGLLYVIKNMAYYEVLTGGDGKKLEGQNGFQEYIRTELGLEYRMALNYINVYEVTRQASIPENQLKGLKCTKVLQLLPLIRSETITKKNWSEWAEKTKQLKGDEFKEAVEKAIVKAGVQAGTPRGSTVGKTKYIFVLFGDRAKVADKAIALAKKRMPDPEDGREITQSEAFDHILSEWATTVAQSG